MSCRGRGFNCPTCYQKDTCSEYEDLVKLNPIGLESKFFWDKRRKKDILEAIDRYIKAEMLIPVEWVKELIELEERGI